MIDVKMSDIVAIIMFIGALILKLSGSDGIVSLIIGALVAYYFGKQRRSIGENKTN